MQLFNNAGSLDNNEQRKIMHYPDGRGGSDPLGGGTRPLEDLMPHMPRLISTEGRYVEMSELPPMTSDELELGAEGRQIALLNVLLAAPADIDPCFSGLGNNTLKKTVTNMLKEPCILGQAIALNFVTSARNHAGVDATKVPKHGVPLRHTQWHGYMAEVYYARVHPDDLHAVPDDVEVSGAVLHPDPGATENAMNPKLLQLARLRNLPDADKIVNYTKALNTVCPKLAV